MKLNEKVFKNYKVLKVTEGDLLDQRPVFTKDGKTLAIGRKKSCHLYSTTTGEHLGQLFECNSNIIALQLAPNNLDELLAVTACGTVLVYNINSDNNPRKVCKLRLGGKALIRMKVPQQEIKKNLNEGSFTHAITHSGLVFASWSLPTETFSRFAVFKFGSGAVEMDTFYEDHLKKVPKNFSIANDLLVLVAKDYVKVSKLSSKTRSKHSVRGVLSVAVHPEENIFATGHEQGKIYLWRNVFENTPVKEVLHWHSVSVCDLLFTGCGSHIYSGGGENVLVKWSLSNQKKTFLPRLNGAIHNIAMSPDNSLFSISTKDGKILVVSPSLTFLATIQHFSRFILGGRTGGVIMAQDPRTDALVLSGRPGHLQFISHTNGGRFLYSLDVTQRNYITGERGPNQPPIVDVCLASFSRCGKWLVTVEAGPEEALLKFWAFDPERQQFALNTHVDCPHGANGISGLVVGAGELAATIGPDQTFRLWGVVESVYMQQTRLVWAQLGYGTHRHLDCHSLDIARDGSLLAVGFGPSLTLWDTVNCSLKCSLTTPLQREPVKVVRFGNGRVSHLVIAGTENELVCWNMVTLLRQWIVPLRLQLLISDPHSMYMCAITQSKSLFIFEPSSPNPEFKLESVCTSAISAAMFVATSGDPQVYFLTTSQELFCLCDVVQRETSAQEVPQVTPFAAQKAQNIRRDIVPTEGAAVQLKKFTGDVLEGPAHGLPHISLLCEDLLKGLLLNAPTSSSETYIPNSEEVMVLEPTDRFLLTTKVDEAQLKSTVQLIFNDEQIE